MIKLETAKKFIRLLKIFIALNFSFNLYYQLFKLFDIFDNIIDTNCNSTWIWKSTNLLHHKMHLQAGQIMFGT